MRHRVAARTAVAAIAASWKSGTASRTCRSPGQHPADEPAAGERPRVRARGVERRGRPCRDRPPSAGRRPAADRHPRRRRDGGDRGEGERVEHDREQRAPGPYAVEDEAGQAHQRHQGERGQQGGQHEDQAGQVDHLAARRPVEVAAADPGDDGPRGERRRDGEGERRHQFGTRERPPGDGDGDDQHEGAGGVRREHGPQTVRRQGGEDRRRRSRGGGPRARGTPHRADDKPRARGIAPFARFATAPNG